MASDYEVLCRRGRCALFRLVGVEEAYFVSTRLNGRTAHLFIGSYEKALRAMAHYR